MKTFEEKSDIERTLDSFADELESEMRTVEQWCADKATPAWSFAAAKAHARWPIGLLVDESTYDTAVHEAAHVSLSAPSIRTRR
jgi:hypothetical protein